MQTPIIRDKIYDIRGLKVMLDFDLAALYGVETRVFNQAVKRNIKRFPEDFMFQLTLEELNSSQIVMSSDVEAEVIDNQIDGRMSQIVISSEREGDAGECVAQRKGGADEHCGRAGFYCAEAVCRPAGWDFAAAAGDPGPAG
jgi:hypothetical protein